MSGEASLVDWKDLHLEGQFHGMSVREAAKLATDRPIAWNGMLAGNFTVDTVVGQPVAKLQSSIGITPAVDGTPIEGHLDVAYDQEANSVSLGNSYVATPATRIDVTGTLGTTLQVRARSTNLEDLIPALAMANPDAPKEIPLKLVNGNATFTGTVAGPLNDPHVTGQVTVANASFEGHAFDRFNGDVEASAQGVAVQRAVLARGATAVEGSAAITPKDGGFEDGTLAAQLNLRNVPLAEAVKEAGVSAPITGTANATVRISGSVKRPAAEIALQVEKPTAYGEQADRVSANVRYAPATIEITAAEVDSGHGKLHLQGEYRHPENDFHDGDVRFDVTSEGLLISSVKAFSKLQLGIDANLDGKLNGTARIEKNEFCAHGDQRASYRRAPSPISSKPWASFLLLSRRKVRRYRFALRRRPATQPLMGEGSWRLEGGTSRDRLRDSTFPG